MTSAQSIAVATPQEGLSPDLPGAHPETDASNAVALSNAANLSAALRRGEEEAFQRLHQDWNGRLYRYCYALARGDAAFAAEIAQATYLRVFRHMRVVPTHEALWNWLAQAARCACADLHRGRSRYGRALTRFAETFRHWPGAEEEPSPSPCDPETHLLHALDAALEQLDEPERKLLEARYVRRQSLSKIASEQDSTSRAIEGRLRRLRRKLRNRLSSALPNCREHRQ